MVLSEVPRSRYAGPCWEGGGDQHLCTEAARLEGRLASSRNSCEFLVDLSGPGRLAATYRNIVQTQRWVKILVKKVALQTMKNEWKAMAQGPFIWRDRSDCENSLGSLDLEVWNSSLQEHWNLLAERTGGWIRFWFNDDKKSKFPTSSFFFLGGDCFGELNLKLRSWWCPSVAGWSHHQDAGGFSSNRPFECILRWMGPISKSRIRTFACNRLWEDRPSSGQSRRKWRQRCTTEC